MKKFLRPLVCGGMLAALLCTPSLAADQGDFSLLVNGEPVTFTDAAPVLKDDRSFLPMAAAFEAMGFQNILWDGEARTVTAFKPDMPYVSFQGEEKRGDLTIQLTIDSNVFTIQYEGNKTAGPHGDILQVIDTRTMDVAPYIDPASDRTYIPVGLVADALGYRVGWDADTYTVVVDDVDAILAANTATYDLMDQFMEYAGKYNEGNYKVDGSVDLKMEAQGAKMSMDGDYNMVTNQTAFQFGTDLALEAGDGETEFSIPSLDMDLRCSLETGKLYFQSEALTESETWYSMDLKAIYDAAYGPGFYEEILALNAASADMSFDQALEEILRSDMLPLSQYATTQDYLDIFNYAFADSSFEKEGSVYINRLVDLTGEDDALQMNIQLFTSRSQVNGYGLEMRVEDESGYVLLTMEMRGDKMEMVFDVQIPDVSMNLTMDGAYRSTREAPDAEPPANGEIVDLMELLAGAVPETEGI